ncbi:uncharacterized protein LOC117512090 [Thalassophryne amazonica]|uniref:uncharacterized protein LOC117512090 n=1 Tax=Thalassophryne amazonica TaxID=390379 RepID=UPI0014710A84|nr:uncharacterized protein LOC117512090 [Thalassophryne amazonica]
MKRRRRRLSPEEDALEHIVAYTDKPFLEERFIDPSKGRGLFTLESIEPNTFVVEYRGNIFPLKELSKEKCGDTLNNYVFEFLWKDEYWCIDASKEDGTFGRLVNDDHRNPNCKLRKIIYEGKPHVCLFALKKIYPGDEITFDYGESSYPWRSNNSSDELVTSQTDVNSSSPSKCSQEKCLKGSTSQESYSEVSQPEDAFHSQEEDKTSSSSEGGESDGDYTPNEASPKPRRSPCTKKHSCYVCGKVVSKLGHHFLMHRKEEAEIAELYCLPSYSKERKKLFQKLQDRGNAKHQRSESDGGEVSLTRQLESSVVMNAEVVVHSQKTEDAQKMTPGVRGMLIRMKQDEITFAVQNDPLLLQLAQSLCDNYENTADHAHHDFTTNTLRELGKLLLILRKKSVFCFEDAVKAKNFCKVVEAVKDFSGFSKVTQTYNNPAVAQKLGNLVRKLGEFVLSKTGNDEQLRSDTEKFIKLCTHWQQLVSQATTSKLNGPKLNNPSTVPFIHDVQLFYKCLETTLTSAVESLKTHEAPCFYNALASVTVAQVSVLNKCASEVSEMTLKSFEEKETTQVLSKHFIRVSIGKTNQKDTVLLTTELVDAITLLVNKRDACGVHRENAFLFAKPDFSAASFYQGNTCIRIFATQCGAAKPEYLRAKEFYKHITRIFQILNLENDELDQLANLLGHSIQSKKEYYRLPEAAADIAKISKLLLTKEKGSLERTQGQSLSGVEFVEELEPDTEQSNFENNDTEEEEETKEEPGCSDVAKRQERQLTPEDDALEHIAACRDKLFLEERFIDFSKGRGVFTLETIEPNTFVVEYQGNIISHPETHETSFVDTLNNYVFDFSWNGTKWW